MGALCVSAHADDVTFFLSEGESVVEVFRIFELYMSCSAAALNISKSKIYMPIGQYRRHLSAGACLASRLKILGIAFVPTGVSQTNWGRPAHKLRLCAEEATVFTLIQKEGLPG